MYNFEDRVKEQEQEQEFKFLKDINTIVNFILKIENEETQNKDELREKLNRAKEIVKENLYIDITNLEINDFMINKKISILDIQKLENKLNNK